MDHPQLASPVVTQHHCCHLRHKGMYVMAAPDPDEFRFYDRFEATAFWCACTQAGFGPDRQPVDALQCSHAGARSCCQS
jgi:hypothetical protein